MKIYTHRKSLLILCTVLLHTHTSYALDSSQQLQLERAGRLIASTYTTGNPDEKLFGLHPDYRPSRPGDMIHADIEIQVQTTHAIQEKKGEIVKLKGMAQFEKWLVDVRNNFRFRDNLDVRTMGTCINGCCSFPIDGGMSHNSLYLTRACFVFKNNTPYLNSITLLDGD